MTALHSGRSHAKWSASSTARNWACPGALTMAERFGAPDRESEAAAWGTACHQVAEKCLLYGREAASLIGTTETTKSHTFTVDEEMAECAAAYVDYVIDRWVLAQPHYQSVRRIEKQFSLESLSPPFEAGGTADAIIYNAATRNLEVVDLKTGRGVVVEVEGNPQLRTYALGALVVSPKAKVETVTATIVQPRAPHRDGRIRSETFHVADLIEWTGDLLDAMRRAKAAGDDKQPLAAWAAQWLVAGDHCKFCPAAAACPALEQKTIDAVGVWFDDLDQPRISNRPDEMDPAEIARKLDLVEMIEGWISSLRAYAHAIAEDGTEVPGYRLVEKQARRKWIDEAAAIAALAAKLPEDAIYERSLKSPAQIEKVLGPKRKAEIADLWHAPVTGTNLVSESKTTRPAVQPAVQRHFTAIED